MKKYVFTVLGVILNSLALLQMAKTMPTAEIVVIYLMIVSGTTFVWKNDKW